MKSRAESQKRKPEKTRDGESQKKEDAGARKGRKVAKHCVFPIFCGSGGSKSRPAKSLEVLCLQVVQVGKRKKDEAGLMSLWRVIKTGLNKAAEVLRRQNSWRAVGRNDGEDARTSTLRGCVSPLVSHEKTRGGEDTRASSGFI